MSMAFTSLVQKRLLCVKFVHIWDTYMNWLGEEGVIHLDELRYVFTNISYWSQSKMKNIKVMPFHLLFYFLQIQRIHAEKYFVDSAWMRFETTKRFVVLVPTKFWVWIEHLLGLFRGQESTWFYPWLLLNWFRQFTFSNPIFVESTIIHVRSNRE